MGKLDSVHNHECRVERGVHKTGVVSSRFTKNHNGNELYVYLGVVILGKCSCIREITLRADPSVKTLQT